MADAGTPGPASDAPRPSPVPTGALLDALFAGAPVGLAFWDRQLRFQRINAELAAMNGVDEAAHLGRRPSEVLPALGPQLEELFRRILDSGQPLRDLDVAGETPAAPGVTRHWLASYLPVGEAGGEAAGIAGLVVEVTGERHAHRRAAEALQRSAFVDAELRALYAALPVGVAFLSPDLRYQRVNETLARMNGRAVEEHLGATLEDIVGAAAGDLRPALQQVMATREPLELELSLPLPQEPSTVCSLEVTYFPVLDGDDRLLGVGGVVRDVTQRHGLEVEQSRLLRDALVARAQAEAAGVRTDDAREEAERARVEAERARERMAFLAQAGRQMAQSMDWESTLEAVVRSAVPALADWCVLTVVDPDGRLRAVAVTHHDPERESLAWQLADGYPPDPDAPAGVGNVVRTQEPEVLEDISPDAVRALARDAEQGRLLAALGVRHTAIAPLKTPAGVIGALSFTLGDSGRRFAPDDVGIITSLAERAALHLQNARLYTERSHIARTLQASLRPRALPPIPGVELAARFLAAGDHNEVGGDFYDVFPSGDGIWTAIVGDVSGKGAEAAAVTALARHTLRTASLLHDDPAANLGLLNRVLHAESTAHDFCTVFYARLRPSRGGVEVRFSNGGHPPPLVLGVDGGVEPVEAGRGPLVGGFADARFELGSLHLQPGELLLLYTDGVTELRTHDLDLGERELRATLAAQAGAAADAVVAAVEQRAVELQGGAPRDDIALVAIRARPDEHAEGTVSA